MTASQKVPKVTHLLLLLQQLLNNFFPLEEEYLNNSLYLYGFKNNSR
jgi:hypothetical protein